MVGGGEFKRFEALAFLPVVPVSAPDCPTVFIPFSPESNLSKSSPPDGIQTRWYINWDGPQQLDAEPREGEEGRASALRW